MPGTTGDLVGLRKVAAELRDEFDRAASELDQHAKNVNIAQITGGAVGVLGGVVAIVGFVALPFTGGASALLVGVGGGIAGSIGGLTAGGAKTAKIFIEKKKLKQVALKWADFSDILLEELKQEPEDFQKLTGGLQANLARMGAIGVEITKDIASITVGASAESAAAAAAEASAAGSSAARASATGASAMGSTAARLVVATAAGSVFLNVVLVGLSLYDIVQGSIEISKKKGSKAGDSLRKLARSLDDFVRTGQWPR